MSIGGGLTLDPAEMITAPGHPETGKGWKGRGVKERRRSWRGRTGSTLSKRTRGAIARGPLKIETLTMRIGRGLTLDPAEIITAQGHIEMRQATVEVRLLVVAHTVVVVEKVATVTGMRSQGQDLEEIMAVEVEAAEETTEGKEREEAIIGGMTVGKEEEVEEEGKEVALMIGRTSSGQDVSSTRIVTLIWS